MDLEHALQTHAEWTQRLRDAAAGAATPPETARIAAAEGCALGDWLGGEARLRLGHRAEWQRCVHAHADFHRAAGSVAAALNRDDAAAARAMLSPGTPYAGASKALAGALRALARAIDDMPATPGTPSTATTATTATRGTATA